MRGEGHLGGSFRMVVGEDGVARVKVVAKEREERTKINRDGVDGGLELRSPSKIMRDISACTSDS